MKLLKIQNISYKICYIQDENSYVAYRKINNIWQWWDGEWIDVKGKKLISKLEEIIEKNPPT